jgi:sugar O-acyltransferase (sialic acid O-acetyltransferase NeuD family)
MAGMRGKLLLVGAGGHCRSVIDSLDMEEYADVAIANGAPAAGMGGIRVVGSDSDAARLFGEGYKFAVVAVGSVGDPSERARLYREYKKIGFVFPPVIDPTAIVSKNAAIGDGAFIGKGAIINTGAAIGVCGIINTGAVIDHDCVVGDFAHVGPNASLSGGVCVGNNSHIGIGCSVIQCVRIGADTVVGAGSVVTGDVPSGVVAAGVPCKTIKQNNKISR